MSQNPRKLGALGFSGRESEDSRIGKCKLNSINAQTKAFRVSLWFQAATALGMPEALQLLTDADAGENADTTGDVPRDVNVTDVAPDVKGRKLGFSERTESEASIIFQQSFQ